MLHRQALTTSGFLGGIAFTGLVFVLSSPTGFRVSVWFIPAEAYFESLVTLLAATSSVFVVGVLGMQSVASGLSDPSSGMARMAETCFTIGFFAFLVDLPMLLIPFTAMGSIVVAILETLLLVFFFRVGDTAPKTAEKPKQPGS